MTQTLDSGQEVKSETKGRILDAAEKLFAEVGFEAASLRQITSEAGVNLAAVNYHFQSKEQLAQAVMVRKLLPITKARLDLLDRVEREHPAGPLPLEDVVEALLRPMVLAHGSPAFGKLLGRMYTEPGEPMRRRMAPALAETVRRFQAAFERALPGISVVDRALGLHFMIGSAAHFMAAGGLLELISGRPSDDFPFDLVIRRLIRYTTAGLRSLVGQEKKA